MNTDDENKVFINLSSSLIDDKILFTFTAKINTAELKLRKTVDKDIVNFTAYKKKLVSFFIKKRIVLFIVENYIYPEGSIEDAELDNYFSYTGAINAASNFYKMMEKTLNMYGYFHGVPVKAFDDLTLEAIYCSRDIPRFQEMINYSEFENKYPEYYL